MASPPETGAALLDEVLSWADSRFGPVHSVTGVKLVGPEPPWWVYTAMLGRAPVGTWYSHQRAGAAGTSIEPREARDRFLGELLERYSALNAPIESTLAVADADGITSRLPRCASDEPCPPTFRSIPPEMPLTHVPVQRLSNAEVLPMPAGFVHLGFWPEAPELPVTLPISTGLAFDRSLARAIWRGLCEVAERDAMMLTWWQRRTVPEIDCSGDGVPEPLMSRLGRLASVQLEARFFDISVDFDVPTVFCVLSGPRYPRVVVGASCKSDPGAACAKAVDEAVSARVSLRGTEGFLPPSREHFDWVTMLEHHPLLYAGGTLTHAFDFLLEAPHSRVPFADFAARGWWDAPDDMAALRSFAREREQSGFTILWTEQTAPEAADYGHVVKVIVPEMVPLSQSHQARWLATPRLQGAAGSPTAVSAAYNPFPHPFA